MRFHWLLLSILSTLLFALPAQAGRLLFWRYENNQNRLVFTTDSRVQPRAQLIPNPTRIVLDLPGITLGRSTVDQTIGGTIKSVRVGQFNSQTTRLVIELAPGYTVDPTQVKVRGISPTQWTVELPDPQRISNSTTSRPNPRPNPPTSNPLPQRPLNPSPSSSQENNNFQVTRNGLFVRLDKQGQNRDIQVEDRQEKDAKTVQFTLPGTSLPQSLINQTLAVNEYGVSDIKFEQPQPSQARLTLRVAKDSPGWQAYYSRLGGLVLLPQGGLSAVQDLTPPNPSSEVTVSPVKNQNPTISTIELTNNDSQLLIRANGPIKGEGSIDRRTGTFEIRIPQAQLADPIQGPQLGRNSPIYQLKVTQANTDTVVIQVRPSLGVRFGGLRQPNAETLSLEVRSLQTNRPPITDDPTTITVPPPATGPSRPITPPPGTVTPRGRVLVVIDPGHGGKDPGAVGLGGLREVDVILPISLEVSQLLKQQGVEVMMTRNADYFVSLQGRTAMANRARANIFVSIHANAVGGGRSNVNGMETFYTGNRELAEAIHRSILRNVTIANDRGVKSSRFYVLRTSNMPSALVEVGFVTGTIDNARLRDPVYRSQMARAIAQGILDYIRQKGL
ncbi:N-acetylmuramoyl-L-alanine amidase [Crocosphaera subtropica ATCC 51142]|uniref:N-acetylmuramoyl-L-alanine amidase n=1 Tax=Crocosphaera subtropica (strain ATCC 51142 / BH68) TaxID=43989 RepID=B1WRG6_CROS5|nr:N-acetylmuramoyl-L-alanine amidase [Crocosphaera subtropica]ACB51815.1 N-acetylmuramoyl-L-alanine amidase [Crocosphaera subtropica ATCC 51142]